MEPFIEKMYKILVTEAPNNYLQAGGDAISIVL